MSDNQTKLPALYQLADEYRQQLDALSDMELDEQTLADTLESLGGELTEKATNVAMFICNLEGMADQIRNAEKQMAERRTELENRAERIRDYLLTNMIRCGMTKIDSPWFSVSVRNNPPSVVIDDMDALFAFNEDYIVTKTEHSPDKKAIAAAIKAGKSVAGVHMESKQSVVIK
jgi:hypothetical protein